MATPTQHEGAAAPLVAGSVPDVLKLGQIFLPEAPTSRIVTSLHALLSSISPGWSLEEQLDWLEALSDWLHRRGWPRSRATTSLNLLENRDARTLHLELLVDVLSDVRPWRVSFSQLMRQVLGQMQATILFSDVGLPQEPGFWREAAGRLEEKLLPQPPNLRRLAELLARILPTVEDAQWLVRVPRKLLDRFLNLLYEDADQRREGWGSLRKSIFEAVTVLSVRICSLGLANDVRERLPETRIPELPFLRLQRICDTLTTTTGQPGSSISLGGGLSGQVPAIALGGGASQSLGGMGEPSGSSRISVVEAFMAIQDCRQAVSQVLSHLEEFGVSVDLVYRLELISGNLGRLEQLLGLLFSQKASGDAHPGAEFVSELIQARVHRRSLRALFETSTHQLARKVVERTGKSGEKYMTETPAEWRAILYAATGAGVLTAGTAILKFVLSAWKLPAFFAGLVASMNYSVSFVIFQLCHFTLATKQPSMTAAALASAIKGRVDAAHLDRLVDMMVRITRAQVAAALGNVGAVIPTALLVDLLWRWRTGHSFLDEHAAEHTAESLHPLTVIPFAALTGVYLWLASIAAGWMENWAVYHHLPEAIAGHRRLTRVFGRRATTWLGAALDHHISGIAGVVTLGFLLGMSPIFGQFFGIPAEVRHVTLSSGALALAAATEVHLHGAHALITREFVLAGFGILITLLLNFGVSFALALAVAFRARQVRSKDTRIILRTVLRRLRHSPLEFFFPIAHRPHPPTPEPPITLMSRPE